MSSFRSIRSLSANHLYQTVSSQALMSSAALVGFMLSSSVGCSAPLWERSPSQGSPSEGSPGKSVSTTGIGALTGAAAGAGLGAIVGAIAGNTGSGLVVGTVAGTIAGSAVGFQMEREERAQGLNSATRSIAESDQQIENQQEEIHELRQDLSDQPAARTRGLKPALKSGILSRSASLGERDLPPVRKLGGSGTRVAEKDAFRGTTTTGSRSSRSLSIAAGDTEQRLKSKKAEVRARLEGNEVPRKGIRVADLNDDTDAPVAKKTAAASTIKSREILPQPKRPTGSTAPLERTAVSPAITGPKSPPVAKSQKGLPAAKTAVKTAAVDDEEIEHASAVTKGVVTSGSSCKDADQDIKRANSATSAGDKLYYLKRAVRICPDNAGYYAEMGRVYSVIGRKTDAKEMFHKALSLEPNNTTANEQLSQMQ